MTLTFIMLALLIAGALAWRAEKHWQGSAKWMALISLALIATVFAIFVINQAINHNNDFEQLQVLTQVDHRMRVMTEESFGPVVGIVKVSSDEAAIKLMNDSDLGLSAAIYTNDIELGIALGDQLETGTFFINRCDYLDPSLAWTGVKNTGRGSTLSSLGFDAFTQAKSYHIKTNP